MPFLSAAATGCPVDVLRLDRCGRVKVDTELGQPYADLHIGELKLSSEGAVQSSSASLRQNPRGVWLLGATARAWAPHLSHGGLAWEQ